MVGLIQYSIDCRLYEVFWISPIAILQFCLEPCDGEHSLHFNTILLNLDTNNQIKCRVGPCFSTSTSLFLYIIV